jgi:hypothetical protein
MITPSTDQLKARILSNEKVFKAWGYYNMAKKVYDKVSIQNIVSESEVAPVSKGPYRPKQWDNLPSDLSQLVLVKTNIGGFFFDAIIRTEHTSTLKITSHPVQNGANITDHSIVEPAVVVMEIGMSDAMDSMVPNQFTERYTKSVSAYQVLLDLQASRIPVSVTTRLQLYKNMLIEEISVPDDVKTLNGLRCTVTLKEVFVVEVARTKVSARPHAMNDVDRGHIQAEKITDETLLAKVTG